MEINQNKYVSAEIEIVRLNATDVIVTSGNGDDMDSGGWDEIN